MQGRSFDRFDQRLDRLITRGRDVVSGVAGARPGGRLESAPGGRELDRRGGWRHELDGLGRWVGNRLDTLLADEADWREPWQDDERWQGRRRQDPSSLQISPPPATLSSVRPGAVRCIAGGATAGRRPLDAISRRGQGEINASTAGNLARQAVQPSQSLVKPAEEQQPHLVDPTSDPWPDDAIFSVPHWSRPIPGALGAAAPAIPGNEDRLPGPQVESRSRPLPRSSRQRSR